MSEKSPLQLLAQTCSQIGTSASNSVNPVCEEQKKLNRTRRSLDKEKDTVEEEIKPNKQVPFKPYDITKDIKCEVQKPKSETKSNKSHTVITSSESSKSTSRPKPILSSGIDIMGGSISSRSGGYTFHSAEGGPYICNWMNGSEYCGKRHPSAEDLLIHLKSHTSLSMRHSPYRLPPTTIFYQGQILPPPPPLHLARYTPYPRYVPTLPPSPLGVLNHSISTLGYPASLYSLYSHRL